MVAWRAEGKGQPSRGLLPGCRRADCGRGARCRSNDAGKFWPPADRFARAITQAIFSCALEQNHRIACRSPLPRRAAPIDRHPRAAMDFRHLLDSGWSSDVRLEIVLDPKEPPVGSKRRAAPANAEGGPSRAAPRRGPGGPGSASAEGAARVGDQASPMPWCSMRLHAIVLAAGSAWAKAMLASSELSAEVGRMRGRLVVPRHTHVRAALHVPPA